MKTRLFALIGSLRGSQRVRHYQGLPPELTLDKDNRNELSWPRVIVLEGAEGNITLNRFTRDGVPVGDTWHQTLEDAKYQAEYEYGDALGEWKQVPLEIADAVDYAIANAS